MNPESSLPLVVLLLVGAGDAGPAAKELEKSVRQLNDAFVTRDADVLKKLMTADHVAITPYAGKEELDKQIKALPNYKVEKYSTEDMKSQAVGKNTVLFTYIVNYKGTYKGKAMPERSIVSSLWVMRDGRWQQVLYQETPVGKD